MDRVDYNSGRNRASNFKIGRARGRFEITSTITKSSNRTPVIGHPRGHAPITCQIGARRTNHDRVFCYRYDNNNNNNNNNNSNNNNNNNNNEDIVDHRSHKQNLSSCEIKA